jgi:hypothetical protein
MPAFRCHLPLLACLAATGAAAQAAVPPTSGAVLVELFTSEGCSDCPPADELLRRMTGKKTPAGQQIIAISEHVTYWNHLGWSDPFSSELFTARQNDYGNRFGLDSVYTPQMVVNGREQFVGGNRTALGAALNSEKDLHQISLHIQSAQLTDKSVTFTYSASDLPPKISLHLVAVLVDDLDTSHVSRGENANRDLTHAWVARSLTQLGKLAPAQNQSIALPLPPSFAANPAKPHHLVLFAQQGSAGVILGAEAAALEPATKLADQPD